MTPKKQALQRVFTALETTFPEQMRTPAERSLVNDIAAVASLGNLTGPQLMLITRMVENLRALLEARHDQ